MNCYCVTKLWLNDIIIGRQLLISIFHQHHPLIMQNSSWNIFSLELCKIFSLSVQHSRFIFVLFIWNVYCISSSVSQASEILSENNDQLNSCMYWSPLFIFPTFILIKIPVNLNYISVMNILPGQIRPFINHNQP